MQLYGEGVFSSERQQIVRLTEGKFTKHVRHIFRIGGFVTGIVRHNNQTIFVAKVDGEWFEMIGIVADTIGPEVEFEILPE